MPLPQLLALCLTVYASKTLKPPVSSYSPPHLMSTPLLRQALLQVLLHSVLLSPYLRHISGCPPPGSLAGSPRFCLVHISDHLSLQLPRGTPVTRACALRPSGPCAPLANRHSVNAWSFDLKIHHEKKVTSFTSRFVPLSSTPDSPPDTSLSWLPVPHSITCWCILPLGLLFHPAISLPCFHFGSRDVRASVSIQLTFLTPPHTACSLDWMQRLVRQGLCPQKSPAWRRIWTRKEANSMSCGEGTG